MDIKEKMLASKTWVVVGVSSRKDKWGYKIWKILKEHGYNTYGVNPNYDEIEGEKIYKSLSDLPEKVDVIDMVVPRKVSMDTLREAKDLGLNNIFFQPGTYDKEVINLADELGLNYLTDDCIYAELKNRE